MLNIKLISKIIGALLGIEAMLMLVCLVVAIGYHSADIYPFVWSVLITTVAGIVFRLYGVNADNNLSRKDAYFVVSIIWVLFSTFATLPFLISGYLHSFTDAFFEMMSGFTTTGATIIDYPEKFPQGLLFWRSLTHWIGGLGIVFFTVAILPSLVGGSVKVFAAEATGPIKSKLHPRLTTSSKWIWIVYLVLTVTCLLSYKICGMGWFDACNYSMATTATGGFGTSSTSIMGFNKPALDYTAALFCFLSGINFSILYASITGLDIKVLIKNSEIKFYTVVVLSFSCFIAYLLVHVNQYDVEHAIRSALFHVCSIITTTGSFNDDAGLWPHITWVVLATCMVIGGCSGSTSGGVKSIRIVMLFKVIRNEFRQILHPNAVLPLKVNGVNISMKQRVTLVSFIGIYIGIVLISSFIMILIGLDNTNAITITLSCIGNVGPTFGREIGPTQSWAILPDAVKWMCSILMLLGRLELFSVLVLFTPDFWKNN